MNKYIDMTPDQLDDAIDSIAKLGDDLVIEARSLAEALVLETGLQPAALWTRALTYVLMNSAIAEGTEPDADELLNYVARQRRGKD